MKDTFDVWCEKAFDYEGRVYENVEGDRGGPTKWGITIGRMAQVKGVKLPKPGTTSYSLLVAQLKALSPAEIKKIYKKDYWDAVRGDDLPAGLDYAVADFGLNSGPSRAAKYLCRCVGMPQSGTLPDAVVAAANAAPRSDLINDYCDARAAFLESIVRSSPSQGKFRKGWLSRVRDVRASSLKLAASPATEPKEMKSDTAMPKADAAVSTRDVVATSRKGRTISRLGKAAHALWISLTLESILEYFGMAQSTISQVRQFVSDNSVALAITGAILIVILVKYLLSLMAEDVDEGRYTPSGEAV